MSLPCAECSAFIPAASHARQRCRSCGLRCILNVLRARQPFRFSRSPAFAIAIDCVRCRFRTQNTPHSFQRLLTHARKRCRSRRLRCIFHTAVRCFSKYSAARKTFRFFPAVVIDRGRSRFCARNALHSLRQLLTLANDAAPVVRATYFYTAVRCLSKYSAARQ